jgi:hypothetical protein
MIGARCVGRLKHVESSYRPNRDQGDADREQALSFAASMRPIKFGLAQGQREALTEVRRANSYERFDAPARPNCTCR